MCKKAMIRSDGNIRSTETNCLTLAQYFPMPGKTKVSGSVPVGGRSGHGR